MTDFHLPPALRDEQSFRLHYRDLILGSLRRSAAAELELQRASGHRLRARRAERAALALGSPAEPLAFAGRPPLSPGLKLATSIGWVAAVGFLAVGIVLFGVRSWWTGIGDVALIALTFAWFYLDTRELAPALGAEPHAAEPDGSAANGHSPPVAEAPG